MKDLFETITKGRMMLNDFDGFAQDSLSREWLDLDHAIASSEREHSDYCREEEGDEFEVEKSFARTKRFQDDSFDEDSP